MNFIEQKLRKEMRSWSAIPKPLRCKCKCRMRSAFQKKDKDEEKAKEKNWRYCSILKKNQTEL